MKDHQNQENNKMRKITAILVLITCVMLLAACGPSEADIQEAIAKTQTAEDMLATQTAPTITPTTEPTQTIEPTLIPESSMKYGDLRDYMITEEDIVKAGYDWHVTSFEFWKPYAEYETTDEDFINSEHFDEFDEAIFKLGRITSWYRQFVEFNKDADGNIETETTRLSCEITSFLTENGAKLAVERYNTAERYSSRPSSTIFDLGDTNVNYQSGLLNVIEFSFKNVVVKITYTGPLDLDIPEQFAQIVFERLQAAPVIP